ncbi:MAG: major capsid protein [bacterium]
MDPNVNMDFIGQGKAQGRLAEQLLSQGRLDIGAMRPFIGDDGRPYISAYQGGDRNDESNYKDIQVNTGTLRRDEWKQLDKAVLDVAMKRLGGIQDLRDHNLVFPLGDAMGTTVLEYHDVSDAMTANLSMDGVTRGEGDRPVFGTNYLPLPIIHVDFEINARVLAAARRNGNPLDTTSVQKATRKVLEKLESMLFTNTSYTFGGGTMYSYLSYPYRNQVSLGTDWDASAKTGAQILQDVLLLKQTSINAYHYGPWMLYVPTAYETQLDEDYVSGYAKSIRSRILEIDGISGIKVVDTLTANNVLLVEMSTDVVRLVDGLGIQVVEWDHEGQFITKYKVMTIQVPHVRADQAQNCGITHLA